MTVTEEKFLVAADLITLVNEAGIKANRQTIHRWMYQENPVPHHRPSGPTSNVYFLWSEVYAWLRNARLTPHPDRSSDAAGQAA